MNGFTFDKYSYSIDFVPARATVCDMALLFVQLEEYAESRPVTTEGANDLVSLAMSFAARCNKGAVLGNFNAAVLEMLRARIDFIRATKAA